MVRWYLHAGVDNEKNLENPKAKTDKRHGEKIVEKNVKNKIKINPPQGMGGLLRSVVLSVRCMRLKLMRRST